MKHSTFKKGFALSVAAAVMALGSAGLAKAETPSWCGPKKASLALLDGYGGNSWRQVTTASGKQVVDLCPSITKYEYADGQGDTQKSISDIKGMAAKGIDALVVFGDAGPAVLPAITSVYKSGKVIVPYRVAVGGKEGVNYSKFIGSSFENDGVTWGNWIKGILPKGGNLLFLSGPAGNSQGLDELKGLKSVLGPEYVFVNPQPFAVTNWDPALTQKVLTAEIAKNAKIDVIVSDFGPSLVGALPTFTKQGKSIPALATSDGNSLGCLFDESKAKNPDFKLFTVATGNDNVRLAVEWAIALATGGEKPKDEIFKAPAFEDSVSGTPNPVKCRKDLPGSIYLSSALSAEDQAKAVTK
ncbi:MULTISPECIES: substrate-binding domain-containing protein [Rhizobium]|uniref:Substrate-binding domain-containing protein n=1 Tax=Rhizobium rhododendri TaxID=2506430 RepID=A0ABY8IQ19_9HYPH|nr:MULTISPECIES: substrate-binding domain-containing protein [Rhizobium]MBO9101664.1 substrate-binding domain-containing protein [Rhizobium sp. L58/93]MBO9170645.1 substrate-binding domain-containing protein [Rhizobium sp. L245/93]MBO9187657.1 substrate-binding domain-containing protein [Rhizobium sp. E27B/91]MBZ5761225.1 substrate-binding domain-containing protein [Rhizobium sp. VS19-DR96]MBZ5766979.1 substrate-binding domain-containing protein [Rhizobium sp. VS19-DR129.2]